MERFFALAAMAVILLLNSTAQASEGASGEDKATTPAVVAVSPAPNVDVKVVPPKGQPKAARGVTLNLNVDLAAQRVTVVDRGNVRHVWPISSGRRDFPTPTGKFVPQWTAKLHHSTQYDDAPMPHSVFFTGGVAFHGTTEVRSLGRPASHGCVRLAPSHAAQLYALVHKHGLPQTRILVKGTLPNAPQVAARERTRGEQEARGGNRKGRPSRQVEQPDLVKIVFGRSGH